MTILSCVISGDLTNITGSRSKSIVKRKQTSSETIQFSANPEFPRRLIPNKLQYDALGGGGVVGFQQ